MKKKIAIGAIVTALVGYGAYKMNILGTTEVKVARIEVGDLSDIYRNGSTWRDKTCIYLSSSSNRENLSKRWRGDYKGYRAYTI